MLLVTHDVDEAVTTEVITERSNLDVDPVPGVAQVEVLETLINDEFVMKADASRFE